MRKIPIDHFSKITNRSQWIQHLNKFGPLLALFLVYGFFVVLNPKMTTLTAIETMIQQTVIVGGRIARSPSERMSTRQAADVPYDVPQHLAFTTNAFLRPVLRTSGPPCIPPPRSSGPALWLVSNVWSINILQICKAPAGRLNIAGRLC